MCKGWVGVRGFEMFVLCVCRPYDTISSFKGFAFHSPHASVSGQRIYCVCVRLRPTSSAGSEVCPSEHIFTGVCPGERGAAAAQH